jgi:AAA domain
LIEPGSLLVQVDPTVDDDWDGKWFDESWRPFFQLPPRTQAKIERFLGEEAGIGVFMPPEAADVFDAMSEEERVVLTTKARRSRTSPPVPPRAADKAPPPDLFRRWSMAELLAQPDEFLWLIRGLLAAPTYGQVAGEMKTLKSYLLTFIMVGLGSGVPIFGRFDPGVARPVLTYVGEGGQPLFTRRLRRICSAMDVDPNDLDLHPSFDIAPISSMIFQESLRRDLEQLEPGLVAVDPYYSFHGTTTEAKNLHEEGALLNLISRPCVDAGASLLVVNHFNQTGGGSSLKRITMAGSGEWADSWLLLEHREQADVENGLFRLRLDIGSRQWGGTTWNLDLDIGRFDIDTGSHDGQIAWDLSRSTGAQSRSEKATAGQTKAEKLILDIIADHSGEKTKTEIKVLVGGSKDAFESAFNDLASRGVIAHNQAGRAEAGTTKKRLLWGMASTKAESDRSGWDGDDL